MGFFCILGQVVEAGRPALQEHIVPIEAMWEQITALSWLQALIAVSFGAVYLLYGWRIFKVLVVISFSLGGLFIGMEIGRQFDNTLWGGVLGLFLLGLLCMPLMRWGVSILGAVAGGILTAAIWYAFELPEKYILAGAIIGVVGGGMISFIIFRAAVTLFTSLGGGVLIIAGLLSLLYHYAALKNPAAFNLKELVFNHNWFLPALLFFTTGLGVFLQNKLMKKTGDGGNTKGL